MSDPNKPLLISCGILKNEIQKLIETGQLDVDIRYLDAKLHYDYELLERALKGTFEKVRKHPTRNVIAVYGDICLGFDYEIKKLVETYGIVKVDALNCVDCLLGGKGQLLKADRDHKYFFLTPGWITFWNHFEKSKEKLKERYAMLEGLYLLDALGDLDDYKDEIDAISRSTGLPVVEKKKIGLEGLKQIIDAAIEKGSFKALQ
jgi:hypothetical protein